MPINAIMLDVIEERIVNTTALLLQTCAQAWAESSQRDCTCRLTHGYDPFRQWGCRFLVNIGFSSRLGLLQQWIYVRFAIARCRSSVRATWRRVTRST